jgi:hypothetical protein
MGKEKENKQAGLSLFFTLQQTPTDKNINKIKSVLRITLISSTNKNGQSFDWPSHAEKETSYRPGARSPEM